MSMTPFEISPTPFPPRRFWTNTGSQRSAQCGNLTVGAGANPFSHSLGRERKLRESRAVDRLIRCA